jgi:arginyl-tRNA synthetase
MNIYAEFHARIAALLQKMRAEGRLPTSLDMARFVVEPPREASLGDLACNAAMVFAKEVKAFFPNPRQLAIELAASLSEMPDVEQAEVAGPGFLNIRLKTTVYADILRAVLREGMDFGRGAAGRVQAKKVNVEYVSANPTGPMHVGHGRGAVFGDALANLLEFSGSQVTREYYINDAGAQVDVLARSAYLRYREALGESVTVPEGLYPGDYLKPVGAGLAAKFGESLRGKPEDEWLAPVRAFAIDAMMDMIREDLAALNIEDLRDKGLIYEGRLPPPKGQLPDDWEDREQTLFRSTSFGDDVDRPLKKSDGSFTYFASDIAYHRKKIAAGYDVLVDVWGADHGGYVKRMGAAVAALSGGKVALDVKLCQLVKLMRDGEPVKMSKRSGDFVTLREVVDEVGVDAARFMMIYRKNDAPLEFDLAKVIEQSKDNPVFYVQYAHARAHSVLRQAAAAFPGLDVSPARLAQSDLALLDDENEWALIRLLAQYPRVVESAASAHEPHRLAFYLHDVASFFHSHWNRGKDQPQLRFVNQDRRDLTCARLALVTGLMNVLASGLSVLGVKAPEEMR